MNAFTIKNIFGNSTINTIMDRLYYEIALALPDADLNTGMCLTGRAAVHLHAISAEACNNVIMLTNDADIYNFVQNILPSKMPNKGVVKFKERTIFYFDGLVLEFWYQTESITTVLRSGIYVQEYSEINPILL